MLVGAKRNPPIIAKQTIKSKSPLRLESEKVFSAGVFGQNPGSQGHNNAKIMDTWLLHKTSCIILQLMTKPINPKAYRQA
jgi:hypothetical protein